MSDAPPDLRLCRFLRWKAGYGARWATRAALVEDLLRGDTPWSCLHTCRPWGPDDALTAPEACQPGRACFAPSPREPRDPLA